MNFKELLGKKWIYADGGTGALLQEMGLKSGEYSDKWNLSHPEKIIEIQKAYFDAGCNYVTTNTFSSNSLRFGDELSDIVNAAIDNAFEARRLSGREDTFIGLDLGPTGKLLEPMGDLPFEDAVTLFSDVVKIGAKRGCDFIIIETLSDIYEAKAALLAAKENSDLPVLATLVFDEGGRLLTGASVESAILTLEGLGADAVGLNCGLHPKDTIPIVKRMVNVASVPVIVKPNAGLPKSENGKTFYDVGPEEFAGYMQEIAGLGVQVIGGCCGTTPAHIKRMIEKCHDIDFKAQTKKHFSAITSYSKLVTIGKAPVGIGERINPTGKKKLKAALIEGDMDYILGEAVHQEKSGADVLDVNVGIPEIDETKMLPEAVKAVQGVTDLPLQLDCSNFDALEAGMRIYNGIPLVNSVNGKAETMEAIFPLIKKYGGMVVGLALDENGIPATSKERINIAHRIIKTAESYGIPKERIVIDALAMTISSTQSSALTALETIKALNAEGIYTMLGVSNISFGLPRRSLINATMLTMAMTMGLSCAIINPMSDDMMNALYAFKALSCFDTNCLDYIEKYKDQPANASNTTAEKKDTKASNDLKELIISGLAAKTGQVVKDEIAAGKEPMKIINEEVIPALDIVGKNYETGVIYLPQLLMSSEAAKGAFDVLKEHIANDENEEKGPIAIATVKNDVHDIGKNIVKVLLENYGYKVYDLGKDVAPEEILENVKEHNIKLVGLSALMTTTVKSMEETIKLLHEKAPGVKIIVGGAVLDKDYASKIHADMYAKDAMDTVKYADEIFNQ